MFSVVWLRTLEGVLRIVARAFPDCSPMALAGGARLFAQASPDPSSAPGPASVAEGYRGSRRRSQRFEYSETSKAGFVELKDGKTVTEQEFYHALASAPGVERAGWTSTKTSQNLPGHHYMEQNINVWVPG